MNKAVQNIIEAHLNDEVISGASVGGGCIADSKIIETRSGTKYFLKQGFSNGVFSCEANGLKEIEKSQSIKTPKLIIIEKDFLLLEYLNQGLKSQESMFNFGCKFAFMHQYENESYGFYEDNFIGSNNQVNTQMPQWSDFYFQNRLLFQFKLAEKNGFVDKVFRSLFKGLEKRLNSILKGSEEAPSLLHGDLWGGNYLIGENGDAVLIDPAVYYGHREADLAMTKLFGGFSEEFYEGYHQTYPLKEGYEHREKIYLLYHVLNHLNLFGSSYYSQAINLMRYYQ
ncbi:fructosamine kinase family protein [Labilibacter marinus]|uniref:fructosamine kinase family protein n=1 Tax=Labilibacter marinus TaxID=1477105 RepID=UPI00082D4B99|nr:fructosamine kinase family protein [Labilibacter marinus]